ncbi:Methionine aminopeptidase 2 [Mycena chlorophos]|uniref:Methionine aminopeptidase 2 n=1 Tax=Mycena chlorophos TaxID=658473 RepID=A0A8H6T3R4_MYCCL|nr:Methionine aminopeptidase 2 [Mycena chlorophos]
MVSDYERQRLANIQRNKALLLSLGLDKPAFEPTEPKRAPKKAAPKKRQAEDAPEGELAPKAARTESVSAPVNSDGPRRSARHAGKTVDYKGENLKLNTPVSASVKAGLRSLEDLGPQGREEGSKRIHNPKTYGSIPGVAVGTWWDSRVACSADSIHAPTVAGITCGPQAAATQTMSIMATLCNTYTGSGGRELKGTKAKPKNLRTAPQTFDQSFDWPFNTALQKAGETKKPVRVIRGFKLKSPYAPYEGYRYDGLYCVEKTWTEQGVEGFLVCKAAFKRLPGQPPLPRRAEGDVSVEGAAGTAPVDAEEEEEGSDDELGI